MFVSLTVVIALMQVTPSGFPTPMPVATPIVLRAPRAAVSAPTSAPALPPVQLQGVTVIAIPDFSRTPVRAHDRRSLATLQPFVPNYGESTALSGTPRMLAAQTSALLTLRKARSASFYSSHRNAVLVRLREAR